MNKVQLENHHSSWEDGKGMGNETNSQYLTYSASTAPGKHPEVEEEGLPGSDTMQRSA